APDELAATRRQVDEVYAVVGRVMRCRPWVIDPCVTVAWAVCCKPGEIQTPGMLAIRGQRIERAFVTLEFAPRHIAHDADGLPLPAVVMDQGAFGICRMPG